MLTHKLWIGGKWEDGEASAAAGDLPREVRSPFSGETVARVDYATPAQLERAVAAAAECFPRLRKTSRHARSALLKAMAEGIAERREELVRVTTLEAGKPVTAADAEVSRAITTFTVASEEAKRFGGEVIPVDVEASARLYGPAVSHWVPRGIVLGITPFNFPVNLVAHKVAPALAVGAPIVIKPAPQAPGGAVLLAEIFEDAVTLAARQAPDPRDAIPLASLQVVSCANEIAERAVTDPRIATVSFTGSTKVGWHLQKLAVGKRVLLELGGNAGVIVHSDADLDRAAARCAAGGFGYAGQSCISVQRIYVHESVAPEFQKKLLAETAKTAKGDPSRRETVVGPMIDSNAADRVMSWIGEAKAHGARVLAGGSREGNVVAPTVLSGVSADERISCEEAFAPVVLVETYRELRDAIAAINRSRFGLQAGVFTDSARLIRQAAEDLEVGGVIINEVPTYRADPMPYGGVKESGLGREGLRYAMEEYSERRTVVQWHGP